MLKYISRLEGRPRVRSDCSVGGRAKQSMRDECDINKIMAKYLKTGSIAHLAKHGGEYGFASSVDFHTAMDVVTRADQMFSALPSDLRARFAGDPGNFLAFVQDEANLEEMVKLGLATKNLAPVEAPAGGERAVPEVPPPIPPVPPVQPSPAT